MRASLALLPRDIKDEAWVRLLGQRLTRAANVRWVLESGDAGVGDPEREAPEQTRGEVLLWACMECGASRAPKEAASQGQCPCGSAAFCGVQRASGWPDAERLKEVVLRLHAQLRPLGRPVPTEVCAPLWGALVSWMTLLHRSAGRISRGGCPLLPLLLGGQVVCMWAEL